MDNKLVHTKESILLATVDVIDQIGIHGLSTREVAKRVGISEPAIFKHFKSKSELLLAVLEDFSHYDLDIMQSVKAKKLKPIESIIYLVDTFASYYENYPAITALLQIYDILRYDPRLSEKIKTILFTRQAFISKLVKLAQEEMEIESDLDCENLAVTIIGMSREYCLNWRIKGYDFPLRERILSSLKIVLDAFTINKNLKER